jgi:signal peptidase II
MPAPAPTATTPRPVPPWRSARAWVVFLVVAVAGLVVDLSSKAVAFRTIADAPVAIDRDAVLASGRPASQVPDHEPITIVPGLLDFTLVLNPGAVFGIGAGKRWVFVVFTVFAMGFALLLFARWTVSADRFSHVALGLLVAGGIGNLYDRLVFACVRDFIHPLPGVVLPGGWMFPWGGREVWPYVSNVADLLLIIGIGMLMWRAIRPHPQQAPRPGARPATP